MFLTECLCCQTWEGWVAIVLSVFVLATIVVVIVNIATFGPSDGEEPGFQCGAICQTLPAGECGGVDEDGLRGEESWWARAAGLLRDATGVRL